MTFKTTLLAAALTLLPATASAHVEITNAYARVASPLAQTAAVYMTIRNHSDDDDRLFRVEGDVADRIELHTHTQSDDGVMRMTELEDGIPMASGAVHTLQPGGDHIMLLGLSAPLEQGDTFEVLVYFDVWVPMVVTVTVDNDAVNAMAEHMEMEHGETGGHSSDD